MFVNGDDECATVNKDQAGEFTFHHGALTIHHLKF